MAPRVVNTPRDPAQRSDPLSTTDSSAPHAHDLRSDTDEKPHGCWDGWVYLGFEGEDEQGEHVEIIERVPCQRCNAGEH
jgi:hypothetical protein